MGVRGDNPRPLCFAGPRGHDYGHVTMGHGTKTVPAGEFKARCLALLDEVAERGEVLVVTKRGVPVARVVPVEPVETKSLVGSVLSEEDLVSPLDEKWDADR